MNKISVCLWLSLCILLHSTAIAAKPSATHDYIYTTVSANSLDIPDPPPIPDKLTWLTTGNMYTHYLVNDIKTLDNGRILEGYVRIVVKKNGDFADAYYRFNTVERLFSIVKTQTRSQDGRPLKKPLVKLYEWRTVPKGGPLLDIFNKIQDISLGKITQRQNQGIKKLTPEQWQELRIKIARNNRLREHPNQ